MKGTTLKNISHKGELVSNFLGPLMKFGFLSMKNVLHPLARFILITLGLTTGALVTDAAIQKKICGSGMTTVIISNRNKRYHRNS